MFLVGAVRMWKPDAGQIVVEVGEHARDEYLAMPDPMPIVSVSCSEPRSRRAVSERLSRSPITRSDSYRNVRPRSVASMPREVRRNSSKPIFVLEQLDLLADRRLRDVEPLRRSGEAAFLVDRKGIAQLAKIQARNPYVIGIDENIDATTHKS